MLEEEKELLYLEFYAAHRKPAEGLLEFLQELRSRGIKTALATSAGPGNIDFIVDGLGIRDQFDAIIGGAEVKKGHYMSYFQKRDGKRYFRKNSKK